MSCCPQYTFGFVNVSSSAVPFTNAQTVEVVYYVDGVWQQAGVFTQIIKTPTAVLVDHGGNGTGVIKIT